MNSQGGEGLVAWVLTGLHANKARAHNLDLAIVVGIHVGVGCKEATLFLRGVLSCGVRVPLSRA